MYTIQSNFTKGELDPQTVARIDLDAYYQGLKLALNVICIPQGGMKKRPGMQYFSDGVGGSKRLEGFSYSTDDNYIVEMAPGVFRFLTPDGALTAFITVPYSAQEIEELDYIQSYDTIIIVHPDHAPQKIVRTSPANFVRTDIPLESIPKNNFLDQLSPTGVSEVQRLRFFESTGWVLGDTFTLNFNGIQTDPIVFLTDDTLSNRNQTAKNIQEGLNLLPNIQGNGVSVEYFDAQNAGRYDITFLPSTASEWSIITGLVDTAGVASNNKISSEQVTEGVSTFEDSWSDVRGWPQTVTFHENRLWFGGSKSLPSSLWGSNVNDYFNFRSYKSRDDEAITAVLDTDQRNAIVGILSNRALQVFTTGQEFYIPDSPITPENISVKSQTNFGSKRVRPVTLSGSTLFIQRTGKSLNDFVYAESENANTTTSKSILSPHLIKNPVQLSIQRGTPDSDANYIYIVNSDGTVTVLNALPLENIVAFTRWETEGIIKSVAVIEEKVYFLTERNGGTYIEVENDSLNMDSGAIINTQTSSITGIERLNGEEITIKTDGYDFPSKIVSGGGVDLGESFNTVEYGLPFYPRMQTMPLNVNLKTGSALYKKKRIKRVALDLYKSNGIIVNGQRIADRTIGVNQFDAPVPYSGLKRKYLQGWGLTADITITQDTPYPFQVLSVGVEVAL